MIVGPNYQPPMYRAGQNPYTTPDYVQAFIVSTCERCETMHLHAVKWKDWRSMAAAFNASPCCGVTPRSMSEALAIEIEDDRA